MHENASGRRADPAADAGEVPARRYQVQWSQDLTASTPQETAETAARQDLLTMFTMDLESGLREVVEVDRGDGGAAAVRMAANEMEQIPDANTHEEGHEFIYRLTAMNPGPSVSRYYKSPYEARGWRDRLREAGFRAAVARVPADSFTPLSYAELDALADVESGR